MRIRIRKVTKWKDQYNRKDIILCRPVIWYILLTVICVFGRQIIPLPVPHMFYTLFRFGVPSIFGLLALPKINTRLVFPFLILESFFGLGYIITYLLGNASTDLLREYIPFTIAICVPFLFFVASLADMDCLYYGIIRISYCCFAVLTMYLLRQTGYRESGAIIYDMPGSYQMLLFVFMYMTQIFRKEKPAWLYTVLSAIGLLLVIIHGSRGPLFCFIVFFALKVITELRHNRIAVFFAGVFIVGLIALIENINYVLQGLLVLVNRFGINSRTISQILRRTILDDSGRSTFQKRALELIDKNFFIGTGVGSDVKLLGGQYAHNLFLELWIDFGTVIGSLIAIYIIYIVVNSLVVPKGTLKDLAIVFLCTGVVMLMISGTYLENINLFINIGLVIYYQLSKKMRINSGSLYFAKGRTVK